MERRHGPEEARNRPHASKHTARDARRWYNNILSAERDISRGIPGANITVQNLKKTR